MKLVYIASACVDDIPYTTPNIIAQAADITLETIIKHMKANCSVFCTRKPSYRTHLCDQCNQEHLTEEQTMFLFTRLQNNEANRTLRKEFARQFDTIKSELEARRQQKLLFLSARQERTTAIRSRGIPYSQNSKFRELAHTMAFGMSAKELRAKYAIPCGAPSFNYLPIADLAALTDAQRRLTKLIEAGYDYSV